MKKIMITVLMVLSLINLTGCKKTQEVAIASPMDFDAQQLVVGMNPLLIGICYTDQGNFYKVVALKGGESNPILIV